MLSLNSNQCTGQEGFKFIITLAVFTPARLHRGRRYVEIERSVQCTESVMEGFNFRNISAKCTQVMAEFH
jgi:hypothetical protein